MSLKKFENIYLIGIGGIGMSALARYFKREGKQVAGYDKTATTLTQNLEAEGIDIHFYDDISKIEATFLQADKTLVIYTPAVPKSHAELNYYINNGFEVKKRSEILGEIAADYFTIAVAGTHGKTTTSTIVAHLLKQSKVGCTAFLGGIAKDYNSNFIYTENSENLVAEADEYDRSFLRLFPNLAIITSMDADHLDIYEKGENLEDAFLAFANNIKEDGSLIYKKGLPLNRFSQKSYSYSITEVADFHTPNIQVSQGHYVFDLVSPFGNLKKLTMTYPGKHNVENAVAAIAAAQIIGVPDQDIRKALNSFSGIKRRFDYQINTSELVYIDDYAHHPKELETCISSVKELYPDKHITGVFQPHLYSRTRDFADGFAKSLSLLDELVMLDIYPAREEPIEGVNAEMILHKVTSKDKSLTEKAELPNLLAAKELQVLLSLGAGDIDTCVEPVKRMLMNKMSLT